MLVKRSAREAGRSGVACYHVGPVRLLEVSMPSAQELALLEAQPGLSSMEPPASGATQERVRYRDAHRTSVLID